MGEVKPLIAVTMGDPAGIGPEIVVKALAGKRVYRYARPLVIGEESVLKEAAKVCGLLPGMEWRKVQEPAAGDYRPGVINILPAGAAVRLEEVPWGRVSASAGRAACACIVKAIELAQQGKVAGVATAPINKEAIKAAGINFIGHTEMFAELTGSTQAVTMFEVDRLRIFFLTRHVSLRRAIEYVTKENLLNMLRICCKLLQQIGFSHPRLAVAALNPHAGEGGMFGHEEVEEIIPAVVAAQAEGLSVYGPVPADSVFYFAARGEYDAVLSLYHDQGHIAAKCMDFERTVSITLGLPFIRTSVDHGTAFDIAGKGLASAVSMEEAIIAAARYAFSGK